LSTIPTDLLRALLAVVDFRSFTKAAQFLGVTQPAVSAQIKRLQILLCGDLFDRSAPGIVLTAIGEAVVNHARRMMAINDQILTLADAQQLTPTIGIGLPGDLSGPMLPWTLAKFRKRWPDFSFRISGGSAATHLSDLRNGHLDIVVALSEEKPTDARHDWKDELVWVRSDATKLDRDDPVPMLAFSKHCTCYQAGVKALRDAGREARLVFTASTVLSLAAAVDAGLGTMIMTRSRLRMAQLNWWNDAPLPALPEVHVGIYIRDGVGVAPLHELADALASLLRPKPDDMLINRHEYQAISQTIGKRAMPQ
jgi:DNA-binding transcriptional LysR family regulator